MLPDPTISRINALLALRRGAAARVVALEGLERSPCPEILAALVSQSFEFENRFAEALEWVSKALEMNPECAFAYFQFARIELRLARYSSARDKLERALVLEQASSYFGLSSLLYSIERQPMQALEHAQAGLALDSENMLCELAEFLVHAEQSRDIDVENRAGELFSKYQESAEMLFSIGIHVALADLSKGRELLAAAVTLQPESDPIRRRYLASLVASSADQFKWLLNGDLAWKKPTLMAVPMIFFFMGQIALLWGAPFVLWFGVVCTSITIFHVNFASGRLQVYVLTLLHGRSKLLKERERVLAWAALALCCATSCLALLTLYTTSSWMAAWGVAVFASLMPLSAVGCNPLKPNTIPWSTAAVFLGLGSLSAILQGVTMVPTEVIYLLWLIAVIILVAGLRLLEPERAD